jgi:aminoglycoside/choline kinase family phosphotransferase
VIDFGDAMLGNIFYELSALHLDLFACDKSLLKAFLQAYGLPPDRDFVRKAMVTSLLHQFDVYGHLFAWKPSLQKSSTLDEFAERLWNINE